MNRSRDTGLVNVDGIPTDPDYDKNMGMDNPVDPFESADRLPSLNEFIGEAAIIQGIIMLDDEFFDVKRIESGFHGKGIKFEKEQWGEDIWYTIDGYEKPDVRKKVFDIVMKKQNRLKAATDKATKEKFTTLTSDVVDAIQKSCVNFLDKTRDQVVKHLSNVYGIKPDNVEGVLDKIGCKFVGESKRLVEIGTLEIGGGAERAMDNTLDNMYYSASTPRIPAFEDWYNNYAGFGISPVQKRAPFLSFDRLPPFHAYVRKIVKDLRIP